MSSNDPHLTHDRVVQVLQLRLARQMPHLGRLRSVERRWLRREASVMEGTYGSTPITSPFRLDHRLLQAPGSQACFLTNSEAVASTRRWPDSGAPPVDFRAALSTASLHPQRLLGSRQFEDSYDSCQSEAAFA